MATQSSIKKAISLIFCGNFVHFGKRLELLISYKPISLMSVVRRELKSLIRNNILTPKKAQLKDS